MAGTPERVATAYRLLLGRTLSEEEAHSLARLLGSRQEVLAAMIARENAFAAHPEVMDALLAAAKHNYSAPRSPRPVRGDARRPRRTALETSNALAGLIALEAERVAAANTMHEAVRDQVQHWPLDLPHPGYHWCVGKES